MLSPAQRLLAFIARDSIRAEELLPAARADSRTALLALADATGLKATEVRDLLQTDRTPPAPAPKAHATRGGARPGATAAHFLVRDAEPAGALAIAERAKANAAANTSRLPGDALAKMAEALVGLNSGEDAIAKAFTHVAPNDYHFTPHPHVEAYDCAGHHVLTASFVPWPLDPKTLVLVLLKASHGRNVEELAFEEHARSVPGRGNRRVVAEVLRRAVDVALDNGFTRIEVTPGFSHRVAALYGEMGFLPPGGGAASRGDMLYLDLCDEASVRQMMQFVAARAHNRV